MNNDYLINLKLKVLKEFQDKQPTSHVGGSIGLMIRGLDLKRDLSKSDLDITIDDAELISEDTDYLQPKSNVTDFDFSLVKIEKNGYYTKIDLRVSPEPSFDKVEFNGVVYNVSKLRDILFWKKKYAQKGVRKH